MNFRASKLTDDEFVERIRRQTPVNRKVAAGLSALYGVMLVAILCGARYIFAFRDMAPDASAYDRGFALGVFLGATVGGFIIVLAWHLVHSLIMAFGPQFFRIHRLLLKYYDAASKAPTESKTNA